MTFTLLSPIVDTADLESGARSGIAYSAARSPRTPSHHFVQAEGLPVILLQDAPQYTPLRWSDGAPQQMHVDLATDDITAGHPFC